MYHKITKEEDYEICELYVKAQLSTTEIAKLFHTNHRTILNHLHKNHIKVRTLSESQFNFHKKELPKEFFNYDDMYDLYVIQHKTKQQLGQHFNCAPHVIDRVLQNLNIHVRDASESKIGVQACEAHHNWQGGITPLYNRCRQYFSNNLAPFVKERDNCTCQICGAHNELEVHHKKQFNTILTEILQEHANIDPIKNVNKAYRIIVSDSRFLDQNNLITLCKQCHKMIHKRQSEAKSN